MGWKAKLKKYTFFLFIYWVLFVAKDYFRLNVFRFIHDFWGLWQDWRHYHRLNKNPHYKPAFQPVLGEKTTITAIDPTYFYQDTWLARKIFTHQPSAHVDVGSKATTIALISQFVPTTMVDIRPVDLPLSGLNFVEGSILALPFADNSLTSLSSICVVEHIGLGRYGDDLDPWGSEKAIAELVRVLASGGNLYLTVPIDQQSKYFFNAQRTFTRAHILSLLGDLLLKEEVYLYGKTLMPHYQPEKGFGTAFYHCQKPV